LRSAAGIESPGVAKIESAKLLSAQSGTAGSLGLCR
jgi:hypothetical protein